MELKATFEATLLIRRVKQYSAPVDPVVAGVVSDGSHAPVRRLGFMEGLRQPGIHHHGGSQCRSFTDL